MNVLFVTYDFPYPTTSGGKNRAYHLIKHTAKGANIFLYSFVRQDYSPDFNEEMKNLGVKKIYVHERKKLKSLSNFPATIFKNSSIFKTLYFEKSVQDEIYEIIKNEDIDVVHFESSYTGFYIDKKLKKLGKKLVLGTENIEYLLYYDYAKSLKNVFLKPIINYQAGRLKKEELKMIKMADSVTVVTESEKEIIRSEVGISSSVVANGIEPDTYKYSFDEMNKNRLLFVGNFSYFPNIDAMNFFLGEIFPKLDKQVTLTIIGKKVNEKFKNKDSRIIKKDFVDDIIPEYKNADILVFPIRIGGGTNFKVLEAMSLGTPIVANPDRLDGLKAVSGEHFLSARQPDQYIDQINRLLNDSALRKNLSKNSRHLIEENYSWEKIGAELQKAWKSQ